MQNYFFLSQFLSFTAIFLLSVLFGACFHVEPVHMLFLDRIRRVTAVKHVILSGTAVNREIVKELPKVYFGENELCESAT